MSTALTPLASVHDQDVPEVLREQVRVWYDHKRGHYVSNVGMVLGKALNIHPYKAAQLLDNYFKSNPNDPFWDLVEQTWVS